MIIETNVHSLRDPFVLYDDGIYYIYGTDTAGSDPAWQQTKWACYKNTSGKIDGEWVKVEGELVIDPEDADANRWAPEVYKFNGSYYMFTTYYSEINHHRGCTVLKSDSPEGPFVEISDGRITPENWDCIDGTPYIDKDGQPWMVFVHEWTCTDDGIGRMAVAKLSDDFTKLISEPVELFRADDPKWAVKQVTDGPFVYTTKEGKLIMIWSNHSPEGYCVGIAHCKDKIDGEWIQQDNELFSRGLSGNYDGGHGMIFKDTDGRLYLSIHSPDSIPEGGTGVENAILVPLREENGTLVWDE